MNEEYIKEITVAAIENNLLLKFPNSEATALEIAKFINTLREATNV